ncbi:MAG: DUF917 domain-containing protein [bacterium]|nr:DUF917 domain-containing protein [bacterium]MDE0500970.1 DUF917 domain-containing protein [bacterium]
MKTLTLDQVDDLALGATLLGTGGGGDPYVARLMLRQAISTYGPVGIVDARELPADGLVMTVAVVGAPTVLLEKIPAGTEFVAAIEALASYLGRAPVALMPIEVGGFNTLVPMAVAAEMGLPVVDADGMRRAFPQVEMTVFTLAGIKASPMSVADEKGNLCVFETNTNQLGETLVRGAVMSLTLANAFSSYSMNASSVIQHAITGSVTYCMELGRLLAAVQRGEEGAYGRFLSASDGRIIFSGVISDVHRETTEGFSKGTVTIESRDNAERVMQVAIQNEFLVAWENGEPVVTVPDLICILDAETAIPINTETLGYGQRVNVVGLPCAPEWHQEGMLEVAGPRAFGFDLDYKGWLT